MVRLSITTGEVILPLHSGTSKIRLVDSNGNHFRKPTQCKNSQDNYVEWMIKNEQISEFIDNYFDSEDKKRTLKLLGGVTDYINRSEFATREAVKITTTPMGTFMDFQIYKYTENFYSFEKKLKSNIKIRITFKMGDYTLAPHLFILLPFEHDSVKIMNGYGKVEKEALLGSGGYAQWHPQKEDIIETIVALARASESHKSDLKDILLR